MLCVVFPAAGDAATSTLCKRVEKTVKLAKQKRQVDGTFAPQKNGSDGRKHAGTATEGRNEGMEEHGNH